MKRPVWPMASTTLPRLVTRRDEPGDFSAWLGDKRANDFEPPVEWFSVMGVWKGWCAGCSIIDFVFCSWHLGSYGGEWTRNTGMAEAGP